MLAEHIGKISDQDIYIKIDSDWTVVNSGKVTLATESIRIDCPLSGELKELRDLFEGLQDWIGDNANIMVIGWDIKKFFSYALGKLGMRFEFAGVLLDLKLLESFIGLRDKPPESLVEAKARVLAAQQLGNWSQFINVYSSVLLPLAMDVLPSMEVQPLADQRSRTLVYSSYDIEGTTNGRLKTTKSLRHSYLPHSMGPEDKENLWPQEYTDYFLYADFKNMEIAVLQWLSEDVNLGKILQSDLDVYKSIWKYATNQNADEEQRESCKKAFLSIVYGAGAKTVGKALNADEEIAEWFINRLEKHFPQAMEWIRNQMHVDGVFIDAFGRRIKLEPGLEYKLQNYAVSSPSAMICLHKLVKLHKELVSARLVFSIHDGYGILTNKYNIRSVSKLVKKILESESELCPGLRLKVACASGARLNSLTSL